MFNIFDKKESKQNLENKTVALANPKENLKESDLYTELSIKKDILSAYLPTGYYILISGHKLVVFDNDGNEVVPKSEARLLRQANTVVDNKVMVGKEVHVVEPIGDRVSKLLYDNFAEDSMTKLPSKVTDLFSDDSLVTYDSSDVNNYMEEQSKLRTFISKSFQVNEYNDFVLTDSENFNDVNIVLDEEALSSLNATRTSGKYTLLLMVESLDTGEYTVLQKEFMFTYLSIFKGIHLKDTKNFRLRLQLLKHPSDTFDVDKKHQDLFLVLDHPTFEIENGVLKNKE